MDIFDCRLAAPMRPAAPVDPFDSDRHLYEPVFHGERCLVYVDNGIVDLANARDRRLLPHFPELAGLDRRLRRRAILDALLVTGAGREPDGEAIRRRLRARRPLAVKRLAAGHPATLVVLDILYIDREPLLDRPFAERRAVLEDIVLENERLCLIRQIENRGIELYRRVFERGLPGVMAKATDGLYRMGGKSPDLLPFRRPQEACFVVCGYRPGDESVTLVLGQYGPDNILVGKGCVDAGAERDDLHCLELCPRRVCSPTAPHPSQRSPSPDEHGPGQGTIWLEPRLVCKVAFWGRTGTPRHPFLVGMLPDTLPYAAREAEPESA